MTFTEKALNNIYNRNLVYIEDNYEQRNSYIKNKYSKITKEYLDTLNLSSNFRLKNSTVGKYIKPQFEDFNLDEFNIYIELIYGVYHKRLNICWNLNCTNKTNRYNKYCSNKCQINSEYNNAIQLDKNGYISNFSSKEHTDKVIKTKIEKYNDKNFNNRQQYIDTCMNRYDVDNVFKAELIKDKCKSTKLYLYGDKFWSNPEKTSITWQNKSDEEIFKIVSNRVITNNFKNTHNMNRDYVVENFIKDGYFLNKEFKEYFNVSQSTSQYFRISNAIHEPVKLLRTQTQKEIYDNIDGNKIFNYKIQAKEIDIYAKDYNFGIEYDGLMWHSFGKSSYTMFNTTTINPKIHLNKTLMCENNNFQLFHIFENEWLYNKDKWLSILNSKMNKTTKIFARNCIIKNIDYNTKKEFLVKNHMQNDARSKVNLGLFYNNILVAVMTFDKCRYSKLAEYELIRYCSLLNTTVIGGFSKLLKYFERYYNPLSILSYANRRWSQGNVYEKNGFTFIKNTVPNYFYFKEGKFDLLTRIQFQKHKLKKILEIYDEKLTETENMFNNKYRKIYDCGNKVYIKYY